MTDTTLMTEASTPTDATPESQAPAAQPEQQPGSDQGAQEQQANSEQQPAADDKSGEGEQPGEAAKPEGAPEKYEFKAQEGSEFNPELIGAFSEVAKELNLSQDAAQKILDKMTPTLAAQQAEAVKAVQAQWTESAKTDKEFGGEKLAENVAIAKKALDTFGSDELRTLLNESGLGNHPEIIRAFYRAGKAISEDTFVGGNKGPAAGNKSVAQQMYPNMNP